MHIYIWQIYPHGQSSIDALNTANPNLADLPQRTSTYKRPFTCEGNYLVRSFVCNTKRPSVKQSMKWKVSSKLADLG